jgi:hypothetical protein
MRSFSFHRTASLAVACAILAACGDGTAPTPKVTAVDSLLAVVNSGQSAGASGAAFAGSGGFTLAASEMPNASSCPFNSTNQKFECPSTTVHGLTFTFKYQLLDGSSHPQSAFSATTTAAIRMETDISGTTEPNGAGAGTLTLTSHSDQTLSGLLTSTRVMNGTGTSTSTFTSNGISGTVSSTMTTTNLVLPAFDSPNPYPQSGTIAMDITSLFGGVSSQSQITMTFNGTSTMTMVMTSSAGTETCTFDMANPTVAPSCH